MNIYKVEVSSIFNLPFLNSEKYLTEDVLIKHLSEFNLTLTKECNFEVFTIDKMRISIEKLVVNPIKSFYRDDGKYSLFELFPEIVDTMVNEYLEADGDPCDIRITKKGEYEKEYELLKDENAVDKEIVVNGKTYLIGYNLKEY